MERRVGPAICPAGGCGAGDLAPLHWGEAAPIPLTGLGIRGLARTLDQLLLEKSAFPADSGGFLGNLCVLDLNLCPLGLSSCILYPSLCAPGVNLCPLEFNLCQSHFNFCQLNPNPCDPNLSLRSLDIDPGTSGVNLRRVGVGLCELDPDFCDSELNSCDRHLDSCGLDFDPWCGEPDSRPDEANHNTPHPHSRAGKVNRPVHRSSFSGQHLHPKHGEK